MMASQKCQETHKMILFKWEGWAKRDVSVAK